MPEVQKHGFSWEKEILSNVYLINDKISYTNKADIPADLNKLDGVDVSIKTTGNRNSVCMSDCLRIYDSLDNNIHLIVILYEQNDERNTKLLKSITHIDLTHSRELLFGTLTRTEIEELDALVKKVPQKRSPTKEEYSEMYSLKSKLQEKCGAIRLDIKCNSQQSRLQCSFNRFEKFKQENPGRILHCSESNVFRGAEITPELISGRRKFVKKLVDLSLS